MAAETAWMQATGPEGDVVMASRVRLARNLQGMPFPVHLDAERGRAMTDRVLDAVAKLSADWELKPVRLETLSPLDRQILVEKHLASPLLVADPIRYEAVVTDGRETVSVMVGEEDHLRIQVLLPGLGLSEAWTVADRLDDAFEEHLDFAFDAVHGYLTAYPTNVGTGLRASVMVHLPALVLTREAGGLFHTLAQTGVVVRGLYGEGSEGRGSIFQISNQVSLGRSEDEMVHALTVVAEQVVGRERHARQQLEKAAPIALADRVGRAFGVLGHARVLTSEEALQLLSDVQLGVSLGLLPPFSGATFSELVSLTRPGLLQRQAGRELDAAERDRIRADLIQEHLASRSGAA